MIVYAVYAQGGHGAAGIALMSVIITCATVRQALFSTAKMGDPLMYCGLPRTVSGYGAMAYVLSHFFFGMNPARYLVGALLITAFSLLNLLPIPYMTHRGKRKMQLHVQLLVFSVPGHAGGGVLRRAQLRLRRAVLLDARLHALQDGFRSIPTRSAAFYARYRAWASEVTRA